MLGWLVAAGSGEVRDDVGPSVRWLGKVAMWAVELAGARRDGAACCANADGAAARRAATHASYAVRWTPALVDPDRLADVVDAMPGSVAALDPSVDARAVTRSALTGMVDAIGRDSARRIEVPAAPPVVRTGNDVTEAFLARLDGSAFDAPTRVAGELVHAPSSGRARSPREHAALIVRLDPPDRTGVWDLEVFVAKSRGRLARAARCSNRSSAPSSTTARSAPTSSTSWPASSACCPRCCAPAPTAAATPSSARTRRGSS